MYRQYNASDNQHMGRIITKIFKRANYYLLILFYKILQQQLIFDLTNLNMKTDQALQPKHTNKLTSATIPNIKSIHILGSFQKSKSDKTIFQKHSLKFLESFSLSESLSKLNNNQCYDSSKKYQKRQNYTQKFHKRQEYNDYEKYQSSYTQQDQAGIVSNCYCNNAQYIHRKHYPYKGETSFNFRCQRQNVKNPQRDNKKQANNIFQLNKSYLDFNRQQRILYSQPLKQSSKYTNPISDTTRTMPINTTRNRQRQYSINLRKRTGSPGYLQTNKHSQNQSATHFIKLNNIQADKQKIPKQIKYMQMQNNTNFHQNIEHYPSNEFIRAKKFLKVPDKIQKYSSPVKKGNQDNVNDFKRIKSKIIIKNLQDIKTVETKFDDRSSEKLQESIVMSKGINLYQNILTSSNNLFVIKKLSFEDGSNKCYNASPQDNQLEDYNIVSTQLQNLDNYTSPLKNANHKNNIETNKFSSASTKYLVDSRQNSKKSCQIQLKEVQRCSQRQQVGISQLIRTKYIEKNNIRIVYNSLIQSLLEQSSTESIKVMKKANILDYFKYDPIQQKFSTCKINFDGQDQFETFCGELMLKLSAAFLEYHNQ